MNRELPSALPSWLDRLTAYMKSFFREGAQLPTTLTAEIELEENEMETTDDEEREEIINMTTEPKTTAPEKPKLAIEEKDGLYHLTIDGARYVATKAMLTGGQLLPFDNIKGLHRFFGGRLNRWPSNNWTWLDGEKETRVRLFTFADRYPDLCGDHEYVEVPEPMVKAWPLDLGWIAEAGYRLSPGTDLDSSDREQLAGIEEGQSQSPWMRNPYLRRFAPLEELPPVYFVPIDDWDKLAAEVIGITWNSGDEAGILEKAASLGREPPQSKRQEVSSKEASVSVPNGFGTLTQKFD
jgi:hypothetical protein